jgi:hypothetical protein
MARTAEAAADILMYIHQESFGDKNFESYRIAWQQLREICEVRKLTVAKLAELTGELNERGYSLACFDDFILVIKESDCSEVRPVPGRVVEQYLPDDEIEAMEDEPEPVEVEDE